MDPWWPWAGVSKFDIKIVGYRYCYYRWVEKQGENLNAGMGDFSPHCGHAQY
jgi:hypothetical protein